MGLQEKDDVTLIRHAYVRTKFQKRGVGTNLLGHLELVAQAPILVGTWANAAWAISFYKKHGYKLVSEKKKDILLRTYWSISDVQGQSSVVLAQNTWIEADA
jgi:GNAT superfamily N-acetyltransferase